MSLLFPKPRKPEERLLSSSSIWGTVDPIAAFLTGSNMQPADESLLRLAPVYAATRLIADQIAALPCSAYTESGGINVKLKTQPPLIEDPSLYGTRYDWTHRMMTGLLLRGNAIGLRGSEYRGRPGKVEWLDPTLVTCQESMPGKPLYYNGNPLAEGEFVHIPAYVLPGYRWGLSPVGSYRSVIAAGLAAQDFAADWFTSGAPVPKGILRNTEQPVVAEAAKAVKESYKSNMSHGDVFVTGKDWEWTSVQLPADDIRFIEMIRASATQIASIYGVPPEMIGGETASSLTYSTVEQNMLNFSTLTLRPWVTRIEAVLTALLPRGQYVKFNLDAVVRSDTKTKYDVFKIQSEMKHRTPNELRALDDLPPLPGGDEFPKPPPALAEQGAAPEPDDDETRHLPGKHDQSSHGKGGGGSQGSGTEDDPIRTGDVDVAAQAILDGKHVQLTSKDVVSSLLGELKTRIDQASAKGGKPKDINLCHVTVPKTNLFCTNAVRGTRLEMPQLKADNPVPGSPASRMPRNSSGEVDLGPGFVSHLRGRGIAVSDARVDASHLKASQRELDADKTLSIAQRMRDQQMDEQSIFVTRDGYIIDGHHRWAATVTNEYVTGKTLTMPVRVLDVDIITALGLADEYTTGMGIPPASMGKRSIPLTLTRRMSKGEPDAGN